MGNKALSRAERERTILIWFAIRIQHENLKYATSYEIAKGLGLSANQKLRVILNEMSSKGLLDRQEVSKQGRYKGSGYMLAEGTYKRPSRTVAVTRKGLRQEVLF
jgi:predicted transcriptional regulator